MRFIIQRVSQAEVTVENQLIGAIKNGFLVFVGVCESDTKEIADTMLRKMLNLRIFQDENGKTNLALKDVGGELLIISQFTLYADCRKGNRPSFIKAGSPEHANAIYEYILEQCNAEGYHTEHGEFGADMKVSLLNDGPFTIVLDSEEICR